MSAKLEVLTKLEARTRFMIGWNLRCNLCGSYGANWTMEGLRPGWGEMAYCAGHMKEYEAELERHREEMRRLTAVKFEQDIRSRRGD